MHLTPYLCHNCGERIYEKYGVFWCDACSEFFYPEDEEMEPNTVPVPDPGTPEFKKLLAETLTTALAAGARLNDLLALQYPHLSAAETAYLAHGGTIYAVETDGDGTYIASPVEQGTVI
jgi:hypothetical protein